MAIHLHIGAHKTGTTSIQASLELMRGTLPKTSIITPYGLSGEADLEFDALKAHLYQRKRGFKPRRENRVRAATFRAKMEGADRHIVSDENIIGWMYCLFDGDFYPDATNRIAAFLDNTKISPDKLYICVRDYGPFFTSAYAYRAGRFDIPPEARSKMLGSHRGWPDLIDDLRSLGIPIRVWVHEKTDLASRIAELADQQLNHITSPNNNNRAPTADAVVKLIAMRNLGPLTREQVNYLRYQFGDGERFALFTEDELRVLTRRCEADLDAISKMSGVEI